MYFCLFYVLHCEIMQYLLFPACNLQKISLFLGGACYKYEFTYPNFPNEPPTPHRPPAPW